MKNIQTLTIDINKKPFQTITANQGEVGSRFIKMNITDNGFAVDLTYVTVYLYAKKSDNTKVFNSVTIEDAKKGIALAELTSQVLALAGIVKLTLLLVKDGSKLASKQFLLNVDSCIVDDEAIESTNEFTALVDALGRVNNIDSRFEKVNSDLKDKTNSTDVYLRDNKININDFDDTTKDALLGADINVTAVLGANNVQKHNLSEEFQKKNGEFIQYYPSTQNGFYSPITGQFSANSGYKSFKQNVNAGDIFSIDVCVASTSVHAIVFLNNSNAVISTLLKDVGEFNDYEFIVPHNATQMAITGRVGYDLNIKELKLIDNVNRISKNSNDISNINIAFKKKNIIQPNEIKTGFYTKDGVWYDNPSYKTSIVSCVAGEVYNCDTKVGSSTLSIVNFYNDSGFVSCLGCGQQGLHNEYEFVIPEGCVSFSITNNSSNPPIIRKIDIDYNRLNYVDNRLAIVEDNIEFLSSPSMFCKKSEDDITIAWKYNSTKDIRLHIEKVGANGLYQIGRIAFVDNSNTSVSNDFSLNETVYQNAVTDWFAPYIMKAMNNADGDKTGSDYDFVGGCHSYDNTTTGVPTARLVCMKLRINGRDVLKSGVYDGSKIEIILINRIQGNNTKKLDGTGREILEETIRLTINEGQVKVENKIKPLEDIRITRYYGLQSYSMQYRLNNGTVYYVNAKDNVVHKLGDSSSGSFEDGSNCRKIIIENQDHILTMELDDIGLVNKRLINNNDNLAFWSNDKLYFQLINIYTNLTSLDMLYFSGKYEFKSK